MYDNFHGLDDFAAFDTHDIQALLVRSGDRADRFVLAADTKQFAGRVKNRNSQRLFVSQE